MSATRHTEPRVRNARTIVAQTVDAATVKQSGTSIHAPLTDVLAADSTKNNSEVLATVLSVSVAASTTYHVKGQVTVDDTAVDAGVDLKLSLPAGATFKGQITDIDATPVIQLWDGAEGGIDEGAGSVWFEGTLIVDTTAGTLAVQFAQTAAAVGATIVKANSSLIVTKLG